MFRISLRNFFIAISAVSLVVIGCVAFLGNDKVSLLKKSPAFDALSQQFSDIYRRLSVWEIDGDSDFEFAWHFYDAQESDLDVLRTNFGLEEVTPCSTLEGEFRRLTSSSLWNVPAEVTFFSSSGFEKKETTGEEFMVAYCMATNEIFVWHVMRYF